MARLLSTTGVIAALLTATVHAAEFRGFNPIAVPAPLPAGAQPVERIEPVGPRLAEAAVNRLMDAWNRDRARLARLIGERFYDEDRLLDNIQTFAPRDATIRVLSVQGVQTLEQYRLAEPGAPDTPVRVSRVSVTARAQVEFNTAAQGFQTRTGTHEYVFTVRERMPP